jgi:threonine/homoserine/homoserine lactone efflux protein
MNIQVINNPEFMIIILKLFSVFALGFLGGSIPGPVVTASFTETLRGGFIKGLRILLMSVVAESIIAIVILSGFHYIKIPYYFFHLVSLVGSLVLVWFAVQTWKIKGVEESGEIFTFKDIFLMLVSGGPFWIFWITVCVPQASLLNQDIWGGYVLFMLIFEAGWLAATSLWVFIFSRFRALFKKKNLISVVLKVLAVALVIFAIKLIVESLLFFFA